MDKIKSLNEILSNEDIRLNMLVEDLKMLKKSLVMKEELRLNIQVLIYLLKT